MHQLGRPQFLNIPWELLRDPTPGRGYLAPLLGGLYRERSEQRLEGAVEMAPGEPFRILLVIARPAGERDLPLGTVARPMLEALRPLSRAWSWRCCDRRPLTRW